MKEPIHLKVKDIIEHPTYTTSHEATKELAKSVKTFHHHYHVIVPILNLLKARTYMEIGSYAGASASLALSVPTLNRIIMVDTCNAFSNQQEEIRKNVQAHNTQGITVELYPCSSTDRNLIKTLIRQAPMVDLLFIDGGHARGDVISDFEFFEPLVRPGGVIVFDDYMDSMYSPEVKGAVDDIVKALPEGWNVLGCPPNACGAYGSGVPALATTSNEFILQKPELTILKNSNPSEPITFAIVMSTYKRSGPASSEALLKRSLASVKGQTYKGWHVFLIGDKYGKECEFFEMLPKLDFPLERMTVVNLPIACEREFMQNNKDQLWKSGGLTAMNYALNLAQEAGFTHTAHLDDDDEWAPQHLATCVDCYNDGSDPSFVYSRGKRMINGGFLPFENQKGFLFPVPSYVLHSSTTWRIDRIPHRYIECPFPADANMWERITAFCKEKNLKSVYTGVVTMIHH